MRSQRDSETDPNRTSETESHERTNERTYVEVGSDRSYLAGSRRVRTYRAIDGSGGQAAAFGAAVPVIHSDDWQICDECRAGRHLNCEERNCECADLGGDLTTDALAVIHGITTTYLIERRH